ncbi:MAG: hypothetical protein Q4C65_14465 [Eubacteriales bacterium]|nr:hypothetical protein [Eubacteriales bacterium]
MQGIKVLKATGGNFVFEFPAQKLSVEAERPDEAIDVANVSVVAVVPYIIMKTAAMGREKAKDAYDIYFIIKHYIGGVRELAKEFEPVRDKNIVIEAKDKLAGEQAPRRDDKFQRLRFGGCPEVRSATSSKPRCGSSLGGCRRIASKSQHPAGEQAPHGMLHFRGCAARRLQHFRCSSQQKGVWGGGFYVMIDA